MSAPDVCQVGPEPIVGLDPGRKALFTAVVHSQQAANSLQEKRPCEHRCESLSGSCSRWQEAAGIKYRLHKTDLWISRKPDLNAALLATPTVKVASSAQFLYQICHRTFNCCCPAALLPSLALSAGWWSCYCCVCLCGCLRKWLKHEHTDTDTISLHLGVEATSGLQCSLTELDVVSVLIPPALLVFNELFGSCVCHQRWHTGCTCSPQ